MRWFWKVEFFFRRSFRTWSDCSEDWFWPTSFSALFFKRNSIGGNTFRGKFEKKEFLLTEKRITMNYETKMCLAEQWLNCWYWKYFFSLKPVQKFFSNKKQSFITFFWKFCWKKINWQIFLNKVGLDLVRFG